MRTQGRAVPACGLALLALIAAACGESDELTGSATAGATTEAAEATTQATEEAAAAATPGRCVKFAGVEATGAKMNLDPAVQPGGENSMAVNAIYNRLMDVDDEFELQPELAESWESNADATEWTFKLREGVKFHDGHELTAADVIYTFKRILDPKTGSASAATFSSFLKPAGVTADGTHSVKFTLTGPVAEFPLLITTKETYIVADGADTETLRTKGAGTGPFVVETFTPGQYPYKFKKNAEYFEEGLPKADCLEQYVIQEATSRNAGLRTGQIDVSHSVDFATLPELKQDPNVTLVETGPSTSMTMSMWTDEPPFDDVKVRQAMKKVVDRQKMVDTVLLGYGTPGDDNPIPPASPYAWRSEAPAPDVEGAKKLLADAGYGPDKKLKVTLYAADAIPGMVNMAQLYKQMAAAADIDVNVVVGPASEHWDNVWLKQPFVVSGWSARPPGEAFAVVYGGSVPDDENNETHWHRDDFDKLLADAATALDEEERTTLYKQAGQMISEEGGVIIPVFIHTVSAMRKGCTGYQPRIQNVRTDFRNVACTD